MNAKKLNHDEIPEVDFAKAKIVRRGPKRPEGVRLTLRALREAAGKTQVELAERLEMQQSEISRVERRDDVLLSTLRKYAAALGATCEVTFVFSKTGHRVIVAEPE